MWKLKQFVFKHFIYPLARLYWRTFNPKTYGSRALVLFENKILIVKNLNVPYWTMPGGKIDKGETPEKCLIRELKEELNLSITDIQFKLGEYHTKKEGKRDSVHVYIVKLSTDVFTKQWELADASWFQIDSLPENISPATVKRINEYKNGMKNLMKEW